MSGDGNEFDRNEVESIYVHRNERFVVSLIVGYSDVEGQGDVKTPEEAAAVALALTRDGGRDGTVWFVHDRKTGHRTLLEQSSFEDVEVP